MGFYFEIHQGCKTKTPFDPYLKPRREMSIQYFFKINGEDIKVCKTMFLNTLSIGNSRVVTVVKKLSTASAKFSLDKRGKHLNRGNTIKQETIDSVITHINLFERKPAHYIRKDSKREYLEQGLNVTKMHKMYQEWVNPIDFKRASLRQYRDIFQTKFNIGFFVPKKDQCDTCTAYEIATPPAKAILQADFNEHNTQKQLSRDLKLMDAKNAKREGSQELCVACFDLRKTLPIPKRRNIYTLL